MKREEQLLTDLLTSFIHNRRLSEKTKNTLQEMGRDSWDRLFYLAQIHTVSGICYVVLKQTEGCSEERLKVFQSQYRLAVTCDIQRENEMKVLDETLEQAGIQHIFFKGWELRKYYPMPALRMMSDVDFLIHKEDAKRADAALKKAGLHCTSESADVYVYEKYSLILEMHLCLGRALGDGKNREYDTWFQAAFEESEFLQENTEGYFKPEYHMTLLVYHIAKHLSSSGAGVRMFMDVAVYYKRMQGKICEKRLWDMLDRLRLTEIAKLIFWLCRSWFDVEIEGAQQPTPELYDWFAEYVFTGGIYGHQKRTLADIYTRKGVQGNRKESDFHKKLRAYRRYFFPTAHDMEGAFPILKKYPLLLPAAWIIRAGRGAVCRGRQSARVISQIGTHMEQAENEYEMLKKLGL